MIYQIISVLMCFAHSLKCFICHIIIWQLIKNFNLGKILHNFNVDFIKETNSGILSRNFFKFYEFEILKFQSLEKICLPVPPQKFQKIPFMTRNYKKKLLRKIVWIFRSISKNGSAVTTQPRSLLTHRKKKLHKQKETFIDTLNYARTLFYLIPKFSRSL